MAASEVIVVDTQPFISHHQGTKRIESILEHWYKDLKANVVGEFLQFKSSVESEQQRTFNELQSKTSPEMMKLRREIDNLRELLHTLERSVSQKDKLVSNLVKSLEKERDKYEKLRAVSSDKLDLSSDESDTRLADAEKNYKDRLLKRCWMSWYKKVKLKKGQISASNNAENANIVTVKSENEAVLSDDSLIISDDEENLLSRTDDQFSLSSAVHGETEGRNYPAYVSTSSNYSFSQAIASKAPGVQSYSVTIAASEDEANLEKTSEDKIVTVISNDDASTLQPTIARTGGNTSTSLPSMMRTRVRKRTSTQSAYERGKKLYSMKDKIRIKKVQSLRNGTSSFLSTNDRPTMATNAFQAQDDREEESPMHISDVPSDAQVVTVNEPFSNQNVIISPDISLVEDSDASTPIVHVQPQFGSGQSDWEAAKNNISQYMNQMISQGESSASKVQKRNENRTLSGKEPCKDTSITVNGKNTSTGLLNEASTSATVPSEPSTSTSQDAKQDAKGEIYM